VKPFKPLNLGNPEVLLVLGQMSFDCARFDLGPTAPAGNGGRWIGGRFHPDARSATPHAVLIQPVAGTVNILHGCNSLSVLQKMEPKCGLPLQIPAG
jgi:hypothetical protein